jgi:hypothetical protein
VDKPLELPKKVPENGPKPSEEIDTQGPDSPEKIAESWKKIINSIENSNVAWLRIFEKEAQSTSVTMPVLTLLQNMKDELLDTESQDILRVLKDIDKQGSGIISLKEWESHSSKFKKIKTQEPINLSFQETADELFTKLAKGQLIWTDFFRTSGGNSSQEKCVISLAEDLSSSTNLPKNHLFSFLKPLDTNLDGMISLIEWNNAHLNQAYKSDPRSALLKDLKEKKTKIPVLENISPNEPRETEEISYE